MATTLAELLYPPVIMGVVSRIRKHRPRVAEWLGFLPEKFDDESGRLLGKNQKRMAVPSTSYRIFNNRRDVAPFTSRGAAPTLVARKAIGEVHVTCARTHPKIRVGYDELAIMSPIAGPQSEVDRDGQDWLTKQEKSLAQTVFNAVEAVSIGMLRGSILLKQSGEQWVPTFTTPSAGTDYITVDFKIPTGNKSQLDMLGGGNIIGTSWANAASPIVQDILEIDAAMVNLHGFPLRHVWCSSVIWAYVITNTEVKAVAGTAATPFAAYDRVTDVDGDGKPTAQYEAVLKAIPWLTWHICDDVIEIDGSTVKKFPDTVAVFTPEMDEDVCQLGVCGEHVAEQPGQAATYREGWYFWSEFSTQPACIELLAMLNFIPYFYVPSSVAYATVVF